MPRILIVTNDFPPTVGGIQSYARDFAALLPPDDVTVLASTQDTSAANRYDIALPYRVLRWPRPILLPGLSAAQTLDSVIRELQIETVWFISSVPLGALAPAARRAGARKIVCSTHGHEVGWSMTPATRAALRFVAKHSDVMTYVSDYTLGRIRRSLGKDARCAPLAPGVDVDFFRPADSTERERTRARWNLGADAPVVTCVSRLVRRKGQDQLIAAMSELSRKSPDAHLVIVGDGSDRRRLETLVDVYGVRSRVTFTGEISREEMRDVMAASDVMAMPARTRGGGLDVEGLGIVYLEAQACGVPVVAGRSGGAPETVGEDAGLVVSGRSRAELTAALTQLLEDPELRQRMGEAGRRHVIEYWSWSRRKEQVLSLMSPS